MNHFNMSFLNKKEFKILGAIVFLGLFLVFDVYSSGKDSSSLRVSFFDVGQGDGIFIQTPEGVDILIDGGPDKTILSKLNKVMPFYDKYIDYLIITHEHEDHFRGAEEVMERYEVGKIYYNGLGGRGGDLITVDNTEIIDLGESNRLEIYSFVGNFDEGKNINNTSLMARLVFEEKSYLFMADIESDLEEYILDSGIEINSDVIKIAHHGSSDSSREEFLEVVSPEVAVITVGLNNDLGHPSRRVVKKLERGNVKIYRTDLDGDIKIISEGADNYVVKTSRNH